MVPPPISSTHVPPDRQVADVHSTTSSIEQNNLHVVIGHVFFLRKLQMPNQG